MLSYRCDNCHKDKPGKPIAVLNGITGTSGGILLPENLHERHFCGPECFWEWVKKFNPGEKAISQYPNEPGYYFIMRHSEITICQMNLADYGKNKRQYELLGSDELLTDNEFKPSDFLLKIEIPNLLQGRVFRM